MDIGYLLYDIDEDNADEALDHFDLAIKFDSLNPETYYARLQLYMDEGRYKEALEDGLDILDLNPRFMAPKFEKEIMPKIKE